MHHSSTRHSRQTSRPRSIGARVRVRNDARDDGVASARERDVHARDAVEICAWIVRGDVAGWRRSARSTRAL